MKIPPPLTFHNNKLLLAAHVLNETQLDGNIDSDKLHIPGCVLHRYYRNRKGGGVAIIKSAQKVWNILKTYTSGLIWK